MELPSNVKIKTFPWTALPLLGKYTAHAIYPNIYIPKNIYENLKSKNPNPEYVSVLLHEQTHIKRQKQAGWFIWGLKYCFSRNFRFNEEFEAIKTQIKYLKSKNMKFDTARRAKYLSGPLYLWCISYKEAKEKLDYLQLGNQ
ncbi:MAG TPA: hypothetical protein VG895_04250 [Patescibacteria group bacterium]|nr:hypothetical protein [Patescibacteria group bacterium]